jgi:hypothetical protein
MTSRQVLEVQLEAASGAKRVMEAEALEAEASLAERTRRLAEAAEAVVSCRVILERVRGWMWRGGWGGVHGWWDWLSSQGAPPSVYGSTNQQQVSIF